MTGDAFPPPSHCSPAWEAASSPEGRSAWVALDHPAKSQRGLSR